MMALMAPSRFLRLLLITSALFVVADAETADASHILVKDASTCADLKEWLDGAEEEGPAALNSLFQELAREHSTCPSGKKGGFLGQFSPGKTLQEIDDYVFRGGQVGKVSDCTKTNFGYHLILVTRKGEEEMDFSDI